MGQRFLHWSPRTEDVVHVDTSLHPLNRHWLSKTTPPVVNTDSDFVMGELHVPASLPAAALHKFASELKYRAELMKEFLFEYVRAEQFPDRPSRRRCMFLFDAELEANAYRERLKLTHASLYEVTITGGRVHRAKTSLLDCNLQPYDTIVGRAGAYWSPVPAPDMDTEVLFEGTATLTRITDIRAAVIAKAAGRDRANARRDPRRRRRSRSRPRAS